MNRNCTVDTSTLDEGLFALAEKVGVSRRQLEAWQRLTSDPTPRSEEAMRNELLAAGHDEKNAGILARFLAERKCGRRA